MSNKVELTEEQIEEMNNFLLRFKYHIEDEKEAFYELYNDIEGFGTGDIDKKLIELFELKKDNLQKQYEAIMMYSSLWDQIVNKFSNVESDLMSSFKNWEDL